ncbi:uncharacterized protein LOC113999125 [Pipra filicauda]|uniref:Uncharacterized protein LOC113999125 n=1 Tax=Pipra filicauda TaxID=649802 RepID=A0A7R5L5R1_9PASS|nr:uncharacterized protein LOC113999125 [Pipra filicauda]
MAWRPPAAGIGDTSEKLRVSKSCKRVLRAPATGLRDTSEKLRVSKSCGNASRSPESLLSPVTTGAGLWGPVSPVTTGAGLWGPVSPVTTGAGLWGPGFHQEQLFLDDTKVKNFITCFKGTSRPGTSSCHPLDWSNWVTSARPLWPPQPIPSWGPLTGVLQEARFFGVDSLIKHLEIAMKNSQPAEDHCPTSQKEFVRFLLATPPKSELCCQSAGNLGDCWLLADLSSFRAQWSSGCDLQEANLRGSDVKGAIFEEMLTPLHMSQSVR